MFLYILATCFWNLVVCIQNVQLYIHQQRETHYLPIRALMVMTSLTNANHIEDLVYDVEYIFQMEEKENHLIF